MKSLSILTGAITLLSIAAAHAASISATGSIAALTPPGIATGTDIADLDAAGVGTDGFIVWATVAEASSQLGGQPWNSNMVDNSPAYITPMAAGTATASHGWANYDDVTLGGTTYNTGGINQASPAGIESPIFSFQLGASVPSVISVGLLTDNSDNLGWAANNVRIEGPGAITANISPVANDGSSDLLQFDITGGATGELYTVYGTSNGNGALIAATTFDSIPEPSGLILLSVAGIALILRRRK